MEYNSFFFKEYYINIKGQKISIDNVKRKLYIFDRSDNVLSELNFSKEIVTEVTEEALLNGNTWADSEVYGVYPNGRDGKNWLWFKYRPIINSVTL